jgi:hypothetical protein
MSIASATGAQSLSTTTVGLEAPNLAEAMEDTEVRVLEDLTMKLLYRCLGENPEMFPMFRS